MPELNSSSIGMAVGALQAINGINLFGAEGGPASIIHVLPDEYTRNLTTLQSALPRESLSKEIDSSLLSVISFPGFAVRDPGIIRKTRDAIVKKLQGKYGCKRFLRDGHQTVLEDTRRLHYEPHELKVFEGIECEWPLFFTYFILDGLYRKNDEQVAQYRAALKNCLVFSSDWQRPPLMTTVPHATVSACESVEDDRKSETSQPSTVQTDSTINHDASSPSPIALVPELFYVPREFVDLEKQKNHSQQRLPNENVPLVWAQSLYIVGELMYEGLLTPSEMNPLGRHNLPSDVSFRAQNTVVQICLISENAELQMRLLMEYGVETQSADQVAPITISSPSVLQDAYSALGANWKLGLTGRPRRPIGTLSTCKLYRVQGKIYAFTPHFMDKSEFYMTMDNDYLVSSIESELVFVRDHWLSPGRFFHFLDHQTVCVDQR